MERKRPSYSSEKLTGYILTDNDNIVIAVPKGRISLELVPMFEKIGIKPEDSFFDSSSRALSFATNKKNISLIRVRSFDVATFVAFGAAQVGIAGNDVLMEFNYPDIYSPLDLKIGKCRMAIAAPKEYADDETFWNASHIRVATKYVGVTKNFFAERGVQAECIKLSGAIELAPKLGLCRRIVDLVSTGSTLKANGMVEGEKIADISSRLIVNRSAFKILGSEINELIEGFTEVVGG